MTLSHSHPPTECFGVFVPAQKPLAALNPRQVWANDLQAAQELTGSRGLMVISTQITQTMVQSANAPFFATNHVMPTGKFIPAHQLDF